MGLIEIILITCILMFSNSLVETPGEKKYIEVSTMNIYEPNVQIEPEIETVYPEHWTCFDFAMNYSELHPEYGMVVISDNPTFQGDNHLVNHKVNNDKTLHIISYIEQGDGYEIIEYDLGGWQYDDGPFDYYHFYINGEIPTRRYSYLLPNAVVVFNSLNEVNL